MGEKKPYFDELDDVSADDVVIATEAQFDETTTSRTGATALRWVRWSCGSASSTAWPAPASSS